MAVPSDSTSTDGKARNWEQDSRRTGSGGAGTGDRGGREEAAKPEGERAPLPPFLEGVRDVSPMVLAVAPFGAVAGLAAVASGLELDQTIALSALVNAGASQLAALQLISQDAPLLLVVITTFFVNLRFLMYSIAMVPRLRGVPRTVRLLMGHILVDQTFAFSTRRAAEHPERGGKVAYYFGLGVPLLIAWNGGTIAGAAFGAGVPDGWSLEFTIPLIFLALLMPAIRDRPAAVASLTGGAVALAAVPLPLNLGLILGALTGIAAGLVAERGWQS